MSGMIPFHSCSWQRTKSQIITLELNMLSDLAAGLVTITSGCSVVQSYAAVIMGLLAGPVYLTSSSLIERMHIDDPSNASAVHFFGGIWGVLSVGA